MKELLEEYSRKRKEIKERLRWFDSFHKKSNRDIFSELCFCILTPQAKAVVCDRAVAEIEKRGLFFKGPAKDIRACLKGVRFPNKKAEYLIAARKLFKNGGMARIKDKVDTKDLFKIREWLVQNVKGFGYKEASHFLRNIGRGRGLAILDRHILKNLKRYGIIRDIPASLTEKDYIEIEKRMKLFFEKLHIPVEEIDLLFWSRETGMIFK